MLTTGLLGKRTELNASWQALKWTVCGAVPRVPCPVCSAWDLQYSSNSFFFL